jgi:hypothetical protein
MKAEFTAGSELNPMPELRLVCENLGEIWMLKRLVLNGVLVTAVGGNTKACDYQAILTGKWVDPPSPM